MVKNLAILIGFLVVLEELGRIERDVVRCENEVVDAGGLQDSHEWCREASYIGLEMLMFAGAHTSLNNRYQLPLSVASGECETTPMNRPADTII
jgi:hypothetical protein